MTYCIYINDDLQLQDTKVIYFLSRLLSFKLPPTKARKKPEKKLIPWSNFHSAEAVLPKDLQSFREHLDKLTKVGFLQDGWFMPTDETYRKAREFITRIVKQRKDQVYLFF